MVRRTDHLRLVLSSTARALGDAPRGDLLVLPELFDGGYAALRRGEGTHTMGDELVGFCAGASRRAATTIVAGTVRLLRRDGRTTNTCLVFSRGRLRHRYDKIHLFRPTGDARFFVGGRSAGTFRVPVKGGGAVRAAVIVCYDLRFPELARALAGRGVELLVVPARWPQVRDMAWRTLLRARAIENQCFVVGCNAPDREGGRSYVYGPAGEELLARRLPRNGESVCVVLERSLLGRARSHYRSLREGVVLAETTFPRWVGRRR